MSVVGEVASKPVGTTPQSLAGPGAPGRAAAPPAGGGQHGSPGHPHSAHLPRRLPRWARFADTPSRLRGLLVGLLVLTAAFGLLCWNAGSGAQSTWSAVTSSQAPQVIDAGALYQSLTDQDAQTANILVDGDNPALAGNLATALKTYSADRVSADRALQAATLSAAGDAAVQQSLGAVLDDMGSYDDLAARAMELNEHAKAGSGRPDPDALSEYRQATDLMQTALLPAADRLLQADNAAFNDAYNSRRSDLTDAEVATLALGGLLLLSLLGVQGWLLLRYRRVFNPPMAAATLLTVLLLGLACTLYPDERTALHTARRDAFDSVVALDRARAVSYDANADESRYVLDQDRREQYQQSFFSDSQQLADLSSATSVFSYDAPLRAAIDDYQADHARIDFGGFLGAEFHNITFPGERAAAEATLTAYQKYQLDDRHLRALMTSGQLGAAVAYNTSLAPGGSNADFALYDAALTKLIAINDDAYQNAAASGRSELSDRLPLLAGGSLVVMVLCLLGARPRLAEYRR
ncbi:hypothetical protein GXW82_26845 [Streptacidiphilus sp. 4-A2]|nr:hypothetical protein [Streptacidiphilus sp. 4-A2]